jgi:hypothetical protein
MPTFTPPTHEGPRYEVISRWTQIRLFSHMPGPTRARNVFKTSDGDYIEDSTDPPALIVIEYIGGHTYEISTAEAAALTAAGYGDYIDGGDGGNDAWFLDSSFLSLTSTEFRLDGTAVD